MSLVCPKCDGPNKGSDDFCIFCGAKLDPTLLDESDSPDRKSKTHSRSFSFLYIISFLIPLVGLIAGAIMASDKDQERASAGTGCIIVAIASIIIGVVFWVVSNTLLYNYILNL